MPTTVKLTISLPAELAEFVDKLAASIGRPRSRVLADLVEEKRREVLRQSMVEGYKSLAEDNRQFAEEAREVAAEAWGRGDRPGRAIREEATRGRGIGETR